MSELLRAHLNHLRRRNSSPATISARRNIISALERWQGRDLADLTADDLHAWHDSLIARNLAEHSIRTYVANVRAFYAWAVLEEYLDRDPARRLTPPKLGAMLPRPVPEDDLRLALVTARGIVAPILILAAFLGLRVGEIARVRREDVIRDGDKTWLLVHGKGRKERPVQLVGDVLADLSPWLCAGGRGAPFTHSSGRPLTGKQVTELVSAHFRALGMTHVAHQLRHRFGTRLYGATRDLRLVQQTMGHSSPTMTAGYVQMLPEEAAAGLAVIAGGLSETRRQRPPSTDTSASAA